MNTSYFKIKLPLADAKKRLSEWCGNIVFQETHSVDISDAVALACDDNGNWKGNAVLLSFEKDWTVFEDLTGSFGAVDPSKWQTFALNDMFVYAGFNDAIPLAELVVIEKKKVIRHFVDIPDDEDENVNIGTLETETDSPIKKWYDVESFIDEDEAVCVESGDLLIWK